MCGIAGIISNRYLKDDMRDVLEKMLDSMKHRGPNGSGIFIKKINSESLIGLAQCRLSIFDLSDKGTQPMIAADNKSVIIYNGEVYNFSVLRHELEIKGYKFKSECDTEVILYACTEWGVERAVERFNGMFAFAYYDENKEILYIARDRMGVKPLYYFIGKEGFFFSSDLRALMNCKFISKDISNEALYGYLWNMYIPSPYSIYKDVFKLEQATILEYNLKNNNVHKKKYWELHEDISNTERDVSEEELLKTLKETIIDATKIRLSADVPVGVFLSGGVDSSLITAIAAENSSKTVNTYSIGFYERDEDATYARTVAKILGTQHEELYCTPSDALALIPELPKAYSEPFADNSQIATMLLSKLTRQHVTVALSGDGGDELFCGYPGFIERKRYYRRKIFSTIANRTIRKTFDRYYSEYDYLRWKVDKFSNALNPYNIVNLDFITSSMILDSLLETNCKKNFYWSGYDEQYLQDPNYDIVNNSIINSLEFSLIDDMLVKIDRASMYYSLECRCPIIDRRIIKQALNIPLELKLKNGRLKYPLKRLLESYIPKEIIDRPKSGFGVPINKWLHSELKDMVLDMLDDTHIRRQGLFRPDGVTALKNAFLKKSSPPVDRIVYTMFVFQLWKQSA